MPPCRRDRCETAPHSTHPADVYIAGSALARRRRPRDRVASVAGVLAADPTWDEAERAGFTVVFASESFSPASMSGTSVLMWIGR